MLTSFGEGLMDKLKGSMKRQGEIVGEATTEAVGTARDLTWARLSGLSKHYQEALKAYCYAVEVEGFQDLPGLALEDVFVPLRIESTEHRLGQTDGPKEIWDFLPKRYQTPAQSPHRRMVILAAPGYGKTTLMRHLTLNLVTDPPEQVAELMPILLRLREVHSLMRLSAATDATEAALSLPDLVLTHLKTQPEFQKVQLTKTWLTEQLAKGTCLVMFDGLDEVPNDQRQQVRQWVDHHMKLYGASQFIITSRPHGFELSPDDPSQPIAVDTKLKVLDFTPDQKQDFVEKWYRTLLWRLNWEPLFLQSQKRAASSKLTEAQARLKSDQEAQTYSSDLMRQIVLNPTINELARNPLLITMIASTHRAQTLLPRRRVELYEKIFDLLLGTRPYAKKTPLTLTATKNRVILQELAWQLVRTEKTQFTQSQCNDWLIEVLRRCTKNNELSPKNFLKEMTDIAGMIIEGERDKYEFSHQTFQEYLASKHLREFPESEKFLLAKLNQDRWQEVICFYAALGDATPIVETILSGNISEYALQLAHRCIEEGREVDQETPIRLRQALRAYTEKVANRNNPLNSSVRIMMSEVRLEQRFKNIKFLYEKAVQTQPEPITWGEYKLFLEAQQDEQFHSDAKVIEISTSQEGQPVMGINWQDARWFCAWLSTQANLQENKDIFNYRFPTSDESKNITLLFREELRHLIPFTDNPSFPGNALVVLREKLPETYTNLVNYLANGRWQEGDLETFRILSISPISFEGEMSVSDLNKVTKSSIKAIDDLWTKFSGGHFGFAVQKRIFVQAGNKCDGSFSYETWVKFLSHVGWDKEGHHENKSAKGLATFPEGYFPRRRTIRGNGPSGWWTIYSQI